MRLDLFLKKVCIVRQRSLAKEICDAGAAFVNGAPAKPAQAVQPGDRVLLRLARRELEMRVLEIPAGNVAKRDASHFIEILRDTPRDPLAGAFGNEDGDSGDAAGAPGDPVRTPDDHHRR